MLRRAFLFLPFVLSGCSSQSERSVYDLALKDGAYAKRVIRKGTLSVAEPRAIASLDTERVAVKKQDGSIAYLPDAVYADRLPRLIQSRLIQTFEYGGSGAKIAKAGDKIIADYALLLEITQFHAALEQTTPSIEIEFSAKIMNDKTGKIIAAFGGKQVSSLLDTSSKGVMEGAAIALDKALNEISLWVTQKI